jgi:hypothetical protein
MELRKGRVVKYTLITKLGKVMTFHVLALAENYQTIYGGSLMTSSILSEQTSKVSESC